MSYFSQILLFHLICNFLLDRKILASLFEKRKPICNGLKKVPLVNRVFDMDIKII